MTMDKVAYHIMRWESTLLDITDVHFSGDTKRVRWSDIAQKGLYEQLDDDCYEPILGRMLSDRTSLIRCELNPQFFDTNAARNALATIMNIETQDWRDQIDLPSPHTPVCSLVDLSAGSYAGSLADVELIFSLAHGDVPIERGKTRMLDNLIGESQIQCNRVAGNYLANQNNPYPRVSIPITNNYRVFDIIPQEWVTVPIAAADTYRGVEWTTDRFLPRVIRFNISNPAGALNVDLELEKETTGTAGIAGYYPTEPPDDDYIPPPTPTPPPVDPVNPPGIDSFEGIRVVGCWGRAGVAQPGILRTEELGGVAVTSPVWSAWTTGINMGTYPYCRGLGRDPWNPKNRLYALMASTEFVNPCQNTGGEVIYRREYSGGAWGNWTAILTKAIVEALASTCVDCDDHFMIGRFSGNINHQGHLYAPVSCECDATNMKYLYFLKSTDYGATWAATLISSSGTYGRRAICANAGQLQGASGHAAGQVIWVGARFQGLGTFWSYVCASVDQGATWILGKDYAGDQGQQGFRLHVDPNNHDIIYSLEGKVDCGGGVSFRAPGKIWKYSDPTNLNNPVEQTTWGATQNRTVVPRVGEPDTMFSADVTVLKDSYDGGATVNNITVDGNVAGAGFPLNWDWDLLHAVHTYSNGANGTRYLQISPDGGTTWYNKHGNMTGNFYGLIHAGFTLDN